MDLRRSVVDGGAFIGDHTIAYLEKAGLNGLVYAFEPNRRHFECLASSRGSSPKGLSDEEGEMAHYPWLNAGAGFLGKGEGKKVVKLDHMGLYELV
jgi:FkbM family methyltransferase